jgi:hypothetical protein
MPSIIPLDWTLGLRERGGAICSRGREPLDDCNATPEGRAAGGPASSPLTSTAFQMSIRPGKLRWRAEAIIGDSARASAPANAG